MEMPEAVMVGARAGLPPGPWPAVVASTARPTRDLDLAEDCTQEAFERAVASGRPPPPEYPAGWLTTTARRDRARPAASCARGPGPQAAAAGGGLGGGVD